MNLSPKCWNIEAGRPFLNTLARWIIDEQGVDNLARSLILLPNRRSCLALREAFLQETSGKPLLLPRIQPIGDVSLAALDIPEPISQMRRRLLLTRLVHKENPSITLPQAAQLASQLANFMDEAVREGVGMDRLEKLVPAELAEHWQKTLDFLKIISISWPAILQEEGLIDPMDHRNQVLRAVAASWKKNPPPYPIIAAGSTGSQPATAELLKTIALLPQGAVVLPGLDMDLEDKQWDMIGDTHPQSGLKNLLGSLGIKRSEVKSLGASNTKRLQCLRTILHPPEATAHWSRSTLPLAEGLSHISLITADTQFEEARMIAVALRQVLEVPGKTAALIAPDRNLAHMVAMQMERFGITLDDSAGMPLSHTPVGCFLQLVCDVVATQAAPSPLLAMLRHPFAALGMETAQCRRLSRRLESDWLRGIRRAPGLDALRAACDDAELTQLLLLLDAYIKPLAESFSQKTVPLKTLLSQHMALTQRLADTHAEKGDVRLWSGEDGNQMAVFLAELMQQSDLLPEIQPQSYPALLGVMMASEMYRPRHGTHPRLHILSPLEARLQQFDMVILGELNEGTWPSSPEADPWMSRPMRSEFGLSLPERIIGSSAHEFCMLAASPEVLLTRAQKVGGSPTVPSRWWVRLETLVRGLDNTFFESMNHTAHYQQGVALLDAPIAIPPYGRPQPTPPKESRPRQLSVTAIDKWLSDPYMIYAQYILNLRKKEPLDKDPDAADFGNLVHKALELFSQAHPEALPANALDKLLECGRTAFQQQLDRPAIACLWWPRFQVMAQWIIEREIERRPSIVQVHSELKGILQWDIGGAPFTLITRIDRLEYNRDQSLSVIDYKTGVVPSKTKIEAGLANQLLLEALVAMQGTLTPTVTQASQVASLEYWKLSGKAEDCKITSIPTEGIESAKQRLETLVMHYDDSMMPYRASNESGNQARFNDYAHLTRADEWEVV